MNGLEGFKYYLFQSDRKKRTVELHLSLMVRLLRFAPQLDVATIRQHLMNLKEGGLKASYINDYIDTLRVYGRYLDTDIYTSLTYFKEEIFMQQTMSDEEIQKFLSLPVPVTQRVDTRSGKTIKFTNDPKGWGIYTMFWKIMAYTGMRPGEVAHLTVDDIDFGRTVFILRDSKTNEPRYVPIAPSLIGDLTEYIKTLEGHQLFPSRRGGKNRQGGVIDDVDWGYNFHKRLKILGIKRKGLRPYDLRPSFITRMLDEDVNIFKVQKIVGHKQIATTAHYTHLTTKDIVKTINRDPLSRLALPYYERLKIVREAQRKLLENYCESPEEEKKMLEDLTNLG